MSDFASWPGRVDIESLRWRVEGRHAVAEGGRRLSTILRRRRPGRGRSGTVLGQDGSAGASAFFEDGCRVPLGLCLWQVELHLGFGLDRLCGRRRRGVCRQRCNRRGLISRLRPVIVTSPVVRAMTVVRSAVATVVVSPSLATRTCRRLPGGHLSAMRISLGRSLRTTVTLPGGRRRRAVVVIERSSDSVRAFTLQASVDSQSETRTLPLLRRLAVAWSARGGESRGGRGHVLNGPSSASDASVDSAQVTAIDDGPRLTDLGSASCPAGGLVHRLLGVASVGAWRKERRPQGQSNGFRGGAGPLQDQVSVLSRVRAAC